MRKKIITTNTLSETRAPRNTAATRQPHHAAARKHAATHTLIHTQGHMGTQTPRQHAKHCKTKGSDRKGRTCPTLSAHASNVRPFQPLRRDICTRLTATTVPLNPAPTASTLPSSPHCSNVATGWLGRHLPVHSSGCSPRSLLRAVYTCQSRHSGPSSDPPRRLVLA